MSKDWEVVQEKAFTAWVNGVLTHVDEKVNDITTDFSDGIKLIHFLELLSNKKIGKKIETDPKSRIHKIQNLHLALQFTETLDVSFQGVGAEDFVDSNKKLILGFLWTLYRKYRIAVIKEGDKSSEEGLLLWCKNTTAGYAGVDIKTFKTGFRDGNAFLALTHKFDPSFDYDSFLNESPEARLERAFDLAEKHMNIPKLLDTNEVMKGTADERSMILYTSLFFHAFRAKAQKDALDESQREAADRLGNLALSLESEKLSKDELAKRFSELERTNESLEKKNSSLENDKNALQASLDEKNREAADLAARNRKLEEEVEELKRKVADLEAKLASALSQNDSSSKRADAEFSGLLSLRQQFDQHVLDMHRWRKIVDVDVPEFLTEVKVPLLEELAKQGDFNDQLRILQGKLTDETKDIHKFLAEKEAFVAQKMKVATKKPDSK